MHVCTTPGNDKILNCYLQLYETRYLGGVSICDLANCKCHFIVWYASILFNVETLHRCADVKENPLVLQQQFELLYPAMKLGGLYWNHTVRLSVCLITAFCYTYHHETSHTDSPLVKNVSYSFWCKRSRSLHSLVYCKWWLACNCFPFTHTCTCTIMKLPTTIMKLHTQTPHESRICGKKPREFELVVIVK